VSNIIWQIDTLACVTSWLSGRCKRTPRPFATSSLLQLWTCLFSWGIRP